MRCCFENTLHYSSPGHGDWGVVRIGMLLPESVQLFVCPSACRRHVGTLVIIGRARSVESHAHNTGALLKLPGNSRKIRSDYHGNRASDQSQDVRPYVLGCADHFPNQLLIISQHRVDLPQAGTKNPGGGLLPGFLYKSEGLERCAGMGELVSGEDSGQGGWVVWVCACVVGKAGGQRIGRRGTVLRHDASAGGYGAKKPLRISGAVRLDSVVLFVQQFPEGIGKLMHALSPAA